MRSVHCKAGQSGAALVVGLMLLLILTVFAVSGMSTATLELVLAGNTQFSENAFQAAESAIEAEFLQGPATPDTDRENEFEFEAHTDATTVVSFERTTFPPDGYSLTQFSADHYLITATGTSGKNARSVNQQGFLVVIPSSSTE
ncbi:MAG: hypothetical protein HKN70_10095 [Gammaproteobacteria bacterium]|nr:hypothetical protein [Gammaproteobacteria bacterium]